MVKENMFNVEKHLNDTLHNPQARGRSHTDREIVAAASVLGRDTYAKPTEPSAEEGLRERGTALGEGGVLLHQRGMVLRVDTAALPKPKQKRHRAAEALDSHNRGNMMKRIQAGGSGASGHAKAAVSYLNKNRTGSDEDTPLVICEGDMMFEDGWAANALQGATFSEPALLRHEEDVDEPSRSKVLSDGVAEAAVVGEKRQRAEITDKVVRDRLGDSSSEDASCSSSGNSSGGEKASHKEAKRHKRKRDKKKHEKSDKKGRRTRRRKEKKEREKSKRHKKH